MPNAIHSVCLANQPHFHPVISHTGKLVRFDATAANRALTPELLRNTANFSNYVTSFITSTNASFAIGGYGEDRVLYRRSALFGHEEPRTIHLGVDIWGPAGTPVFAPLGGMVHSFAFNNHYGDYGATIILQHQLDTISFHTLYGHLALRDLHRLHEGMYINRGDLIGHFGVPEENGDWPPHLHFQLIDDLRLREGDYPGVCTRKEMAYYLENCPDPDCILDLMRYAKMP